MYNRFLITIAMATLFVVSSFSQEKGENVAALKNIMTRCSVRKFKQQSVEASKIEKMLRAGMAAPSSRDMQPWHFVVIEGRDNIEKLASLNTRHADQIRQTPLIIVVCADTTRMQSGEARDFWVEDVSAASQNILLAAHALNLGAVWTSVYPQTKKVNAYKKISICPII